MPTKRGFRVSSKEIIKLVQAVFGEADSLDKEQFRAAIQGSKEICCMLGFFNKNLVRTIKVLKRTN